VNEEAFAMNSTELVCVPDSHANTATYVTGAINHTQGICVPLSNPNKLRMKSKPQNENPQDQIVTEVIPLPPTPVSVHNLEEALTKILFQSFVTILLTVCT
jgi:hypothetical protein